MFTDSGRGWRTGFGTGLLLMGSLGVAGCGDSTTAPSSVESTPNLAGRYTLTLRPSERCVTFVDSLDAVSFETVLKQQGFTVSLDVKVTLGGIRYPVTLHGRVHENELSFGTADCPRFTGEAFKSDISPNETFGMCGASVATITNPARIAGTFSGTLEYYKVDDPGRATASTSCSAPDHAVILEAT